MKPSRKVVGSAAIAVLLAMGGCARGEEPVGVSEAALEAESSEATLTPEGESPEVTEFVALEEEALQEELGSLRDPEARWRARVRRFEAAEQRLRRDLALTRAEARANAVALRDRLLASAEAEQDYATAEAAREARGDGWRPTSTDLELFAAAQRGLEVRQARREPLPRSLTVGQESTPSPEDLQVTPTREQLSHGGRHAE